VYRKSAVGRVAGFFEKDKNKKNTKQRGKGGVAGQNGGKKRE